MFEHLDDPDPPDLGGTFRTAVHRRGRQLRRRRLFLRGGAVTASCTLVLIVGLYVAAARQADDVTRLDVAGTGTAGDDAPMSILVVGLDDAAPSDGTAPAWTDTLLVVRIDADDRISTLAIPRDLAVEHPETGDTLRINGIAPELGLSALVAVVESQLALPLDHLVAVDFHGFVRLVDLVGGVDVHASAPMRDRQTGLVLEGSGCERLDGRAALALARSRSLETLTAGGWQSDSRGDLGRIERQPVLLMAALRSLGSMRPGPLTANQVAGWVADNVAIDDTLSRGDLTRLAEAALALDPDEDLIHRSLPVAQEILEGGAAVLVPATGSDDLIDRFVAGTLPEDPAGSTDPPLLVTCER